METSAALEKFWPTSFFVSRADTHTHTHTPSFNGPFSRTTWLSQYQKGNTNLDFTEARDSEWQWHQLGHMQVCTSLQTDNHASTPPLSFYSRADLYRNRAGSFTVTFMSYHCTVAELSLKNNVMMEIWVNFLTFSFRFLFIVGYVVLFADIVLLLSAWLHQLHACVSVCACACVCVCVTLSWIRNFIPTWSWVLVGIFSSIVQRLCRVQS